MWIVKQSVSAENNISFPSEKKYIVTNRMTKNCICTTVQQSQSDASTMTPFFNAEH